MEHRADHEIDDLLPPPPRLRRVCAKRGCRADARPAGGRLCRDHHAASMRRWRARRRQAGQSVAATSPEAASSSPEATRARKVLERARRRGAVTPGPCVVCTVRDGVVAVHIDPADLRTIAWACRGCRHELVRGADERRAEAERDAAQRAQRERNARELQEALEAVAMLPTDVAAALRAKAARGPYPFPLRPETPLYKMRLAAAVRRFKAGS